MTIRINNNIVPMINPNCLFHHQHHQQAYIVPGITLNQRNRFLGASTSTLCQLSLCLLVGGFGLLLTGLMITVLYYAILSKEKESNKKPAAFVIGISLTLFGFLFINVGLIVLLIYVRWKNKKDSKVVPSNIFHVTISQIPFNSERRICSCQSINWIQQNTMPFQMANTSYNSNSNDNHDDDNNNNNNSIQPTAPPME